MNPHSEKGYSAAVKLELRADGRIFELASVSLTKVVLRNGVELPACRAEVAVFVDDCVSVWPVRIPGAVPFDTTVMTQSCGEMRREVVSR